MKQKMLQKLEVLKAMRLSISEKTLERELSKPESVKESEKNFDGARIEKFKKDINKLRDKFSKSKVKVIRKDLHRIEKKFLPHKKQKRLKKNLSKLKKYHDYDDTEYRGMRDVKDLFNLSIDEDY